MHLSLVSAQNVEIMWLTTYWEYMCMHTGVQTTCVSNTPWGCLWGVTSLRESWNVIWGCGGLAALGIQSRRSLAKGSGVSILGHVSGIRNLDPPDPQRAVKYCWKGRKKKRRYPLEGSHHGGMWGEEERGRGAERTTDGAEIERKRSGWNQTEARRYPSRAWMWQKKCVSKGEREMNWVLSSGPDKRLEMWKVKWWLMSTDGDRSLNKPSVVVSWPLAATADITVNTTCVYRRVVSPDFELKK